MRGRWLVYRCRLDPGEEMLFYPVSRRWTRLGAKLDAAVWTRFDVRNRYGEGGVWYEVRREER